MNYFDWIPFFLRHYKEYGIPFLWRFLFHLIEAGVDMWEFIPFNKLLMYPASCCRVATDLAAHDLASASDRFKMYTEIQDKKNDLHSIVEQ